MKRYVRSASAYDDEEFVPNLTDSDADDIVERLKDRLYLKYSRRYRSLDISVTNVAHSDRNIGATVIVRNKGEVVVKAHFKFAGYDSYFDETDFDSHLNQTIYKFVESL